MLLGTDPPIGPGMRLDDSKALNLYTKLVEKMLPLGVSPEFSNWKISPTGVEVDVGWHVDPNGDLQTEWAMPPLRVASKSSLTTSSFDRFEESLYLTTGGFSHNDSFLLQTGACVTLPHLYFIHLI